MEFITINGVTKEIHEWLEIFREENENLKNQLLEKKLEEAKSCLSWYADESRWDWERNINGDFIVEKKTVLLNDNQGYTRAQKCLEEIENE